MVLVKCWKISSGEKFGIDGGLSFSQYVTEQMNQ